MLLDVALDMSLMLCEELGALNCTVPPTLHVGGSHHRNTFITAVGKTHESPPVQLSHGRVTRARLATRDQAQPRTSLGVVASRRWSRTYGLFRGLDRRALGNF